MFNYQFFFFFCIKNKLQQEVWVDLCVEQRVKLKSTIRIFCTIRKLRKLKNLLRKRTVMVLIKMYIYHYRGIHIIFKISTSLCEEKTKQVRTTCIYVFYLTWTVLMKCALQSISNKPRLSEQDTS